MDEARKAACMRALRALGAFLFKHHLPIGLIFVVVLGGLWPTPGVALNKLPTSYVCVIIIFLISGLKLKTDDLKEAVRAWKASLYGLFSILFLTSVICLELIKLLGSQFDDLDIPTGNNSTGNASTAASGCQASNSSSDMRPLGPREFSTGLQVFFAMPCTVSSGVIMVTQVNGNYALSLLLTVVANLLGIATVPGLLNWLGDFGASVQLNAVPLLVKLVLTLLIPLLVGKALRYLPKPKVAELVGKHRNFLKVTSNVSLIILPWMKISVASSKGFFDCVMPVSILAIFAIGFGLHLLLLGLNSVASLILRLKPPNKKSIVILCSQKTLAVAVSVLTFFPAELGEVGLMTIPCIISHLVQIITDALLVSAWLAYDKRHLDKLDSSDKEEVGEPADADGEAVEMQIMTENRDDPQEELKSLDAKRTLSILANFGNGQKTATA